MNKNCLILGKRFVVLLFVLFLSFCKAEAKDVTLKSGTQIPLELQGTITSKNVSMVLSSISNVLKIL